MMKVLGSIAIGVALVLAFHLPILVGGVVSFISYLAFSKK